MAQQNWLRYLGHTFVHKKLCWIMLNLCKRIIPSLVVFIFELSIYSLIKVEASNYIKIRLST